MFDYPRILQKYGNPQTSGGDKMSQPLCTSLEAVEAAEVL